MVQIVMSANAFVMSFMATPHNPPAHAAALQVRFEADTTLDVVDTIYDAIFESTLPSTC